MAKTSSKSQELHYAKYKNSKTFEANRKRKLLRLIKLQPNNEQLPIALANMRGPRSTPKVPKWSHTAKADAKMYADFKKVPALQPKKNVNPYVMPTQPFSLGERARWAQA